MEERRIRERYERERYRTKVGEESRTKQSFKDECDINRIMKRHAQTGLIDHLSTREPHYGDFSAAVDLHTAMEQVRAAQDDFAALPSEVRNLCLNNPEVLLRALASPEETAALFDAGLPMADEYKPWREDEPEEKAEAKEDDKQLTIPEVKPPVIKGGE